MNVVRVGAGAVGGRGSVDVGAFVVVMIECDWNILQLASSREAALFAREFETFRVGESDALYGEFAYILVVIVADVVVLAAVIAVAQRLSCLLRKLSLSLCLSSERSSPLQPVQMLAKINNVDWANSIKLLYTVYNQPRSSIAPHDESEDLQLLR